MSQAGGNDRLLRHAHAMWQIRMLRYFVLPLCRMGDVTNHAIVVADADGTIRWWSPGAEILFGHSAASAPWPELELGPHRA
jgi:hypothetical protein